MEMENFESLQDSNWSFRRIDHDSGKFMFLKLFYCPNNEKKIGIEFKKRKHIFCIMGGRLAEKKFALKRSQVLD